VAAQRKALKVHKEHPLRDQVVTAYVGLGANLGEAKQAIEEALKALAQLPQSRLLGQSHLYRSAPHQAVGADFINAVACLETRLTAPDLLLALQRLESAAGRQRPYLHAPRTLDLDLLLYGDAQMQSPALMLPHPRMWERAFVLWPLADVAPEKVQPQALQSLAHQSVQRLVLNKTELAASLLRRIFICPMTRRFL